MEEAKGRWLRPNEIHAILYNYKYFTINVKPVNLPQSKISVTFSCMLIIILWLTIVLQFHPDLIQPTSPNIIHDDETYNYVSSSLPISLENVSTYY